MQSPVMDKMAEDYDGKIDVSQFQPLVVYWYSSINSVVDMLLLCKIVPTYLCLVFCTWYQVPDIIQHSSQALYRRRAGVAEVGNATRSMIVNHIPCTAKHQTVRPSAFSRLSRQHIPGYPSLYPRTVR